jgi:hypothetical protein
MAMIKASLDTTHFSFTAYGQTTSHAVNALKRGLDQHTTDYGCDNGWWHTYSDDIVVEYIELNKAYRDSELIKVAA